MHSWCYLLLATASLALGQSPIVINEVSVWNDKGLADASGERGDWIELLNTSEAEVDLAGYALSDDPKLPQKWKLTNRVLGTGGILLVFASGKDLQTGRDPHANFNLRAAGGVLLLTKPDGGLAEQRALLPTNVADISQGRSDSGGWTYFAKPTPRGSNGPESFAALASPPAFSKPSGFHQGEFDLTINAEAGTEIRYTLDGAEPSKESLLYSSALRIVDRSPEPNGISEIKTTTVANQHTNGWRPPNGLVAKGTVVRARAFREGALPSAIVTANYYVGIDPAQRFKLPVITLTSPPDGLFDYNRGIYVLGKVFDDYRKANPREALTGHTPANYTQRGAAWARPAYFEFFEPDGKRGLAMNVSIDIHGQSTRSFRQKAFGVNPRGDLSPTSTIDYPVFPGLKKRGTGEPLKKLKGLRLRNSGNDWDYTMFRDALCHRLTEPLGIDTQAYRPAVVFLNGEFWGLYDVREQLEREYLESHYDVPLEQMTICETDASLKEGKAGDEAHFRTMRSFLSANDPAVPENFAKVATMMDVDNFLKYHLAEIYLGNADWPHNNIRFWRKTTAAYAPDAPFGHDGRWRWIMFDLDLGYSHPWSLGVAENALASVTNLRGRNGDAPWSSLIMRQMLLNPGFKADFINRMADYLNSIFSENRATTMCDEMQAVIEPVMAEHIKRWRTSGDSVSSWKNNVRTMRTFASQRPRTVRQHFNSKFALGGTANLTVDVAPSGAGLVRVNSLLLEPGSPGLVGEVYPWQGVYFKSQAVRFQAIPRPGYAFSRWEGLPESSGSASLEASVPESTVRAVFQRTQPVAKLGQNGLRLEAWPVSLPSYLRLETTAKPDPGLTSQLEGTWTLAMNLATRSRVNGLGSAGLGFLNTSDPQDPKSASYVGALVLALDTSGIAEVFVAWTGGTIAPNERVYGIRLQYAVGDEPFQDVLDAKGQPVEYLRSEVAGHEKALGPVALPARAANQAFVQLRWKYYFVSGDSGARAQLRVDEINITSAGVAVSASAGEILSVRRAADGQVSLRFLGTGSQGYSLQFSPDLRTWRDAEAFQTDATGLAEPKTLLTEGQGYLRVALKP